MIFKANTGSYRHLFFLRLKNWKAFIKEWIIWLRFRLTSTAVYTQTSHTSVCAVDRAMQSATIHVIQWKAFIKEWIIWLRFRLTSTAVYDASHKRLYDITTILDACHIGVVERMPTLVSIAFTKYVSSRQFIVDWTLSEICSYYSYHYTRWWISLLCSQ